MKRSRKKSLRLLQRRGIDQSPQQLADAPATDAVSPDLTQDVVGPNGPLDGAESFSNLEDETALLTADEERQLAHSIQAGGPGAQAALNHFVIANQRLVYKVAKRYQGQGLEFLDLVQEGNIGLLRAIERFEPERGYRFSTMAVWWIRRAITGAIADTGRAIRLPAYQRTGLLRLKQAEAQFTEEHGRSPSNEELAEILGLSLEMLSDLRQVSGSPRSLSDSPGGDEDDLELGDTLADPSNLEEDTVADIFSEEVQRALKAVLTPREYLVMRRRFGLGNDDEQGLAEIGRSLGRSRERIRQIEERAIKKLRNAPQVQALLGTGVTGGKHVQTCSN